MRRVGHNQNSFGVLATLQGDALTPERPGSPHQGAVATAQARTKQTRRVRSRPATTHPADGQPARASGSGAQASVAPRPPAASSPPLSQYVKGFAQLNWAIFKNGWRPSLRTKESVPQCDPRLLKDLQPALATLENYHRYAVHGFDHIPDRGAAIVLFEHSLATYDLAMLSNRILEQKGRVLHPLVADQLLATPFFGKAASDLGAVRASHGAVSRLLESGEMVAIAPDGVRGWIHPTNTQKYEVDWSDRRGYVIKALQSGVPVLTAACPGADDIFDVYDNALTRQAYARLKIPMPLFTGKHGIPGNVAGKPAELIHVIGKPIRLPHIPSLPDRYRDMTPRQQALVDRWHRKLQHLMDTTIVEALALRIEREGAARVKA